MKYLIQTAVALGFGYLAVSLYEFVFYGKNSGALVLATILLGIGFGGLFIYNRISGEK